MTTRTNGRTVLLVEDDDRFRELVRTALERSSYTVVAAADGHAALDESRRIEGPIDLLLTDVVMPGMSGVQLAEQLRTDQPGLRVLFMSGFVGRSALPLDRAVAFIAKPFMPSDLLRRIEELLAV